MDKPRICFIIGPIGDTESAIRKRSDQIFNHIITPVAQECGYTTERADQIDRPGIITNQVIQHIVNDPLVIADLTDYNPNVFYELALRHIVRKPLIQMIKQGQELPFDVAPSRTIYFDHQDLDSVALAEKQILEQIKAIEKDPSDLDTPISVSIDLESLKHSEKREKRLMADVLSAIGELRRLTLGNQQVLNELRTLVPLAGAQGKPFVYGKPIDITWDATSTPPHRFYGTVRIDGKPPPDGTTVSAVTQGLAISGVTTVEGRYVLDVFPLGTRPVGMQITFRIANLPTEQTAVWEMGELTNLDLSVRTR